MLRRITKDIHAGEVIDDIDARRPPQGHLSPRTALRSEAKSIETTFVHNDEDVGANDRADFARLAKGAVRSEIRLQDRGPNHRQKFFKAMEKE